MIRKSLTILSLIGLLLSVGLWGVSCQGLHYLKEWPEDRPNQSMYVILRFGTASGTFFWERLLRFSSLDKTYVRWVWGEKPSAWFHYKWRWLPEVSRGGGETRFSMPLYLPLLVFASWPLSQCFSVHRRRKRKKLGLCVKCGYDLRGSKERCPECGTGY